MFTNARSASCSILWYFLCLIMFSTKSTVLRDALRFYGILLTSCPMSQLIQGEGGIDKDNQEFFEIFEIFEESWSNRRLEATGIAGCFSRQQLKRTRRTIHHVTVAVWHSGSLGWWWIRRTLLNPPMRAFHSKINVNNNNASFNL